MCLDFTLFYSRFLLFAKTNLFHARIQSMDRGSGPHLKIHRVIGFLTNTGLDPLKITSATKPAINVGPSSTGHQNQLKNGQVMGI